MICRADNEPFISKILDMKSKDISKLLKEEDQKYILRKKQQITQNMPQFLKPNMAITSKNRQNLLKNILHSTLQIHNKKSEKPSQFPSMFDQKGKTNMRANQNNNFSSKLGYRQNDNPLKNTFHQPYKFQSGISGQFDSFLGKNLPYQIFKEDQMEIPSKTSQVVVKQKLIEKEPQQFQNQKQMSFHQIRVPLDQVQTKIKAEEMQEEPNQVQTSSKVSNPFAFQFSQPTKYSPFISNHTNFLDMHSNKKSAPLNYLQPQTYSMNLLQYAHNKKKQNTFNDGYSYPNTVMGGTGVGIMKLAQQIRQNPFKKTFAPLGSGHNNIQKDQTHIRQSYQNTIGLNKQSQAHPRDLLKMRRNQHFQQNIQEVMRYTLGDKRFAHTTFEKNNFNNVDHNNKTKTYQKPNNNYSNTLSHNGISAPYAKNGINNGMNAQDTDNSLHRQNKRQRQLQNPFVRRPGSTKKY